jgi:hypothetical protein
MLEVVKPATEAGQCAYVDLLRPRRDAHGRPLAAPATVFVSHAWGGIFTELVDAALQSLGDQGKPAAAAGKTEAGKAAATYFWLDIMTVNQWRHEALPDNWWSTTFAQARRDMRFPSTCVANQKPGQPVVCHPRTFPPASPYPPSRPFARGPRERASQRR